MKPELELSTEAELHLRNAERALIEVKPADAVLQKTIETLQRLAILPRANRSAEFIDALKRIRRVARLLQAQVRHGNNLCRGWMQIASETGYGADGLPVQAASIARSWEV